jgi:hypothetical protein
MELGDAFPDYCATKECNGSWVSSSSSRACCTEFKLEINKGSHGMWASSSTALCIEFILEINEDSNGREIDQDSNRMRACSCAECCIEFRIGIKKDYKGTWALKSY